MQIHVSITLAEGEELEEDANTLANSILSVVGGDEEEDICSVHVMHPAVHGAAGNMPPPLSEDAPE
jgi:hypothetical protein